MAQRWRSTLESIGGSWLSEKIITTSGQEGALIGTFFYRNTPTKTSDAYRRILALSETREILRGVLLGAVLDRVRGHVGG